MKKDIILVIGSCGQIGTELTAGLREKYGTLNVIGADKFTDLTDDGPYHQLDVLNMGALADLVRREKVTQIYLLAAMLSASGERNIHAAWQLNMDGLLNVLKVAAAQRLDKVFWPSSIAVFGPSSAKHLCPQEPQSEPNTVYGISKRAGEYWCKYYFEKHNVDVRSIRFPGLISYATKPGGGTTDYAVHIFHEALEKGQYDCFLKEDASLPMMYMKDAVRATLQLMDAPKEKLRIRTSYNLSATNFAPCDLSAEIKKHLPDFTISYNPDYRQAIAEAWPASINDLYARQDWNWEPQFSMQMIVTDMLLNLKKKKEKIKEPQLVHDFPDFPESNSLTTMYY